MAMTEPTNRDDGMEFTEADGQPWDPKASWEAAVAAADKNRPKPTRTISAAEIAAIRSGG